MHDICAESNPKSIGGVVLAADFIRGHLAQGLWALRGVDLELDQRLGVRLRQALPLLAVHELVVEIARRRLLFEQMERR